VVCSTLDRDRDPARVVVTLQDGLELEFKVPTLQEIRDRFFYRKAKSSDKPARPPNKFFIFRTTLQGSIDALRLQVPIVSSIASEVWAKSSNDVRSTFTSLAAIAKAEHSEINPGYVYKPFRKNRRVRERRRDPSGSTQEPADPIQTTNEPTPLDMVEPVLSSPAPPSPNTSSSPTASMPPSPTIPTTPYEGTVKPEHVTTHSVKQETSGASPCAPDDQIVPQRLEFRLPYPTPKIIPADTLVPQPAFTFAESQPCMLEGPYSHATTVHSPLNLENALEAQFGTSEFDGTAFGSVPYAGSASTRSDVTYGNVDDLLMRPEQPWLAESPAAPFADQFTPNEYETMQHALPAMQSDLYMPNFALLDQTQFACERPNSINVYSYSLKMEPDITDDMLPNSILSEHEKNDTTQTDIVQPIANQFVDNVFPNGIHNCEVAISWKAEE
jgi:hypothetical protein